MLSNMDLHGVKSPYLSTKQLCNGEYKAVLGKHDNYSVEEAAGYLILGWLKQTPRPSTLLAPAQARSTPLAFEMTDVGQLALRQPTSFK